MKHRFTRLPGLFFFLLISFPFLSSAQPLPDLATEVVQKMEWYKTRKQQQTLYVHFDKNVYASNENVWFTGYLLWNDSLGRQETMAVSLLRNEDSAVLAEGKFILANGLSMGNLKLPDSLQPGNYSLVAYTNSLVDGEPVARFVQPVTIKTATPSFFTATLKMGNPVPESKDSMTIVLKASAKDIYTLISNAPVDYSVGAGANRLHGQLKTNVYGELSFKLPLNRLHATDGKLRVKLSYKNETKQLQLQLPLRPQRPEVKFFPEGGNLAASAPNRVGWEVKDSYGEPMMVSGMLYKDGLVEDTIQTNAYGFGTFRIFPAAASRYEIKLVRGGQPDTAGYLLPPATTNGLSINITTALCDDTLRAEIYSNTGSRFQCMVHNYRDAYADFSVHTTAGITRVVKIALDELPKGIAALTILDTLGRPLAERLFFAHYNQRTVAEITSDSSEYHTRQKVKLDIRLRDQSGKPVTGLVSVACVQDNRVDPRKSTDIETYTYLNDAITKLPYKKTPLGAGPDNRAYLEEVLLIKGWRRYTWSDLMQSKAEDAEPVYEHLVLKGEVFKKNGKKSNTPVMLTYLGEGSPGTVTAGTDGGFAFTDEQLLLLPEKKIMLFVSSKNAEDYAIRLHDPYKAVTRKVFEKWSPEMPADRAVERNSETLVLKAGEMAPTLATVTVSANKTDDAIWGSRGVNACGDYVCQYGILNCQNHIYGTIPVKGKTYRTPRMGAVIYQGCAEENKEKQEHILFLKGIYAAQEFYNTDYSKINATEEMFLSTIYWNHSLVVDATQKSELWFYTSDIPGKFRVVVQGVTGEDVLFGEYQFNVIK